MRENICSVSVSSGFVLGERKWNNGRDGNDGTLYYVEYFDRTIGQ